MRSRASSSRSVRRSDTTTFQYPRSIRHGTFELTVECCGFDSGGHDAARAAGRRARADEDRGRQRAAPAGRSAAGEVGDAGAAGRVRAAPARDRAATERPEGERGKAAARRRRDGRERAAQRGEGPARRAARAGPQAERVRRRPEPAP